MRGGGASPRLFFLRPVILARAAHRRRRQSRVRVGRPRPARRRRTNVAPFGSCCRVCRGGCRKLAEGRPQKLPRRRGIAHRSRNVLPAMPRRSSREPCERASLVESIPMDRAISSLATPHRRAGRTSHPRSREGGAIIRYLGPSPAARPRIRPREQLITSIPARTERCFRDRPDRDSQGAPAHSDHVCVGPQRNGVLDRFPVIVLRCGSRESRSCRPGSRHAWETSAGRRACCGCRSILRHVR